MVASRVYLVNGLTSRIARLSFAQTNTSGRLAGGERTARSERVSAGRYFLHQRIDMSDNDLDGIYGSPQQEKPKISGGFLAGMVVAKDSPSGTERDPSPPPPQSQTGAAASVADTLVALGVFVLHPARLRAVAASLSGAGIEGSQLRDLDAYLKETEEDGGKVRKYLATILSDPARAIESIQGLAAHRAASDGGPPHIPNMPWGAKSCACHQCKARKLAPEAEPEAWQHDRKCREAWCLFHSDRWTHERLMEHFGVKKGTIEAMLARGQKLSEPPPHVVVGQKKKEEEEDLAAEAKRRAEFRNANRQARLKLLRGGKD